MLYHRRQSKYRSDSPVLSAIRGARNKKRLYSRLFEELKRRRRSLNLSFIVIVTVKVSFSSGVKGTTSTTQGLTKTFVNAFVLSYQNCAQVTKQGKPVSSRADIFYRDLTWLLLSSALCSLIGDSAFWRLPGYLIACYVIAIGLVEAYEACGCENVLGRHLSYLLGPTFGGTMRGG